MNEESLQRLFSVLRKDPAETTLQDVTEWLNHPPPNPSFTKKVETLISKKIILMTSSIVVIVTGAVLFFSPQKEQSLVQENQSTVLPASSPQRSTITIDSFKPTVSTGTSTLISKTEVSPAFSSPDESSLSIDRTQNVKTLTTRENNFRSNLSQQVISISDTALRMESDTSGAWFTSSKQLTIDTLFSGVEKLILKGHFPSQIKLGGENRNTVAFQYRYEDRKKGIFFGKNPGCKVTYTKSGTTLFVSVDIKQKTTVGFSFGNISSEIFFTVPTGINVSVESSFGDIRLTKLVGGDLQLKTTYGDIDAEGISGSIKLQSNYGDIAAQDISGRFELITAYGDIRASKVRLQDSISLSSGYGDIDCKLLNGEDSCRLKLSTSYGKILVKGNELDMDSKGKLQFGNGPLSISAATSFGDVKIRFVE
jgi:hypothetical protein